MERCCVWIIVIHKASIMNHYYVGVVSILCTLVTKDTFVTNTDVK